MSASAVRSELLEVRLSTKSLKRQRKSQEVRLARTANERERMDNLAELYAVLNSLECLEKAYIRDCVSAKE